MSGSTTQQIEHAEAEVTGLKARFNAYRDQHPWLQHVIEAWQLLQRNHGNQYAAAITYFSFLALFPLLLVAVSVTGFVLSSHPGLEHDFFSSLTRKVPGGFGTTLKDSLRTAIRLRTSLGIVGLAGVFLTGSAWIGNLREAIDAVWGRTAPQRNMIVARLANLGVLGGLGVGLLVSLGLTAVGTSLTDQILSAVGLSDLPGATAVLKVLGIAIAAAGDSIVFWWVLVRMPQQDVPRRVAVQGAVMASIGFEVLKIVGTYTIAHATKSPTAGPFGSILAVLIWIQLVARYMLFTCAWMATAGGRMPGRDTETAEQLEGVSGSRAEAGHDAAVPAAAATGPTPAAVGATLVGAGAVAGFAAGLAWLRPRRRRHRRRRPAPTVSRQPW